MAVSPWKAKESKKLGIGTNKYILKNLINKLIRYQFWLKKIKITASSLAVSLLQEIVSQCWFIRNVDKILETYYCIQIL